MIRKPEIAKRIPTAVVILRTSTAYSVSKYASAVSRLTPETINEEVRLCEAVKGTC